MLGFYYARNIESDDYILTLIIQNKDNIGGLFKVSFATGDLWFPYQYGYIEPGDEYIFQERFSSILYRGHFHYEIIPPRKEIVEYFEVAKQRTVTKYRDVTKYKYISIIEYLRET